MKKIFTTLFAGLLISAQVMAITVMDVCGRYDGTLLLDSEEYPESQVYLLPGVTDLGRISREPSVSLAGCNG